MSKEKKSVPFTEADAGESIKAMSGSGSPG